MRVLVTGSTGYVGGAVARELVERGHDVLGGTRSADADLGEEVTPVLIDLRRPDTLRRAAGSVDAVVHTAYVAGADTGEVDRAAVAALHDGLDGRGTLVYTGGSTDYGDTGERAASEQDPPDPPGWQRWRPRVENDVLTRSGTRGLVVRPALIYGDGGNATLLALIEQARTGALTVIGDGRNVWSTVHVRRLAALYAALLEDTRASGVYNAASEQTVTFRELISAIAEAAGVPDRPTRLDLATALQRLGPWAEGFSWNQRLDSTRARTALHWDPDAVGLLDDLTRGSYRTRSADLRPG